jgi:sortase A
MIGLFAAALILLIVVAASVQASRMRPATPATATATTATAGGTVTGSTEVRAADPLSHIVGALRRHKWLRRSLSVLSVALLAGAIGLIGYPFYTNLVQSRIQARLDRQLASPELRQAYLERRIQVGDSLTRIKIPAIDVDVVVVEGTTSSALRAGAGHYPSTPLPCEQGNVGIAGHRTTYGRPFNNLDLLAPGDLIVLETPIGICTYKVSEPYRIVAPDDTSVVGNVDGASLLTLTTCHPKGSAAQRLVIRATLVSSELSSA